jgi:type I restriction enzyme S subunit
MSLSNCEWKEYKLGELVEITNGFAFKSNNFLLEKIDNSLPVVKIKNVANGDVQLNDCLFHKYDDSLKKYLIKKNDILIAMTGNHPEVMTQVVGEVTRYKLEYEALLNQRVAKIEAKTNLDKDFLYYFLKDDITHDYLASQSAGSANQANISKANIEELIINCPSLSEQRAIASILSSLDDKIDLLHRQNKTLEALAETLFRQWFLSIQKSNVKSQKFGNLVQFIKGKKPNNAVEIYIEGLVPQILIETFDTGKTLYSDPTDMVIANKKDLLMVMDGASSGRTEIGICGIVGSTIGLFRPTKDFYYPLFLFYFLKVNEDFIKENTTGSAIPHTDRALVLDLDVEYPSIEKVKEFEFIAENYFDKKLANKNQIRTLTQLRDTLLPKLMSGEVKVRY